MAQSGSSVNFDELMQHQQRFLAFLEHRVGSRADAEDILQRAYVKALQREDTLRQAGSAVAWFYRILRNAVIDHYRSQAAAGRRVETWAQAIEDTPAPDPEMRAAVCECIVPLLQTLKPEYQQALQALELDEKSLQEFSAEAGITPQNAAVRVHRARQALKKRVIQICGTCAQHGCVDCRCDQRHSAA